MIQPSGETVVENSVWKEILTPGDSRISENPREGSTCVLKIDNFRSDYLGHIANLNKSELSDLSSKQHSTILRGDAEVTLIIGEADSEIDKRIERAIQLMKDCECARITIAVKDPPTIVEGSKISFDATLLKHERFKPIWEWTPQEKFDIAMRYKNAGVKLFKDSESSGPRYKDAFYRFSRACKILISLEPVDDLNLDEALRENIQSLRLKLYNNMAACQAKHHNYYHVIELCSKVLARNDKDVLTLFRRGYAYGELKDYERAVQDFTTLLGIEPTNKQAIMRLQHYRSCLRLANIHCNEMVKRMFKT